jgi:uncharacterized protein YdeI (YjbR/CyaY-like superfamily)
MNSKVDAYIDNASKWKKELEVLRAILLDCGLTEELKWGSPCYSFKKSNVAIIGELKDSCVLSFFKGALLQDANGILSKPGENSQHARLIRFTNVNTILDLKSVLKAYIFEAIEVEKAGLKIDSSESKQLGIPEEFQHKINENPSLKTAFEALTPGRQRAYLIYFSAAKQSKSRVARIEKYTQRILSGKGINDCTCGVSKKMPGCDGSHKYI